MWSVDSTIGGPRKASLGAAQTRSPDCSKPRYHRKRSPNNPFNSGYPPQPKVIAAKPDGKVILPTSHNSSPIGGKNRTFIAHFLVFKVCFTYPIYSCHSPWSKKAGTKASRSWSDMLWLVLVAELRLELHRPSSLFHWYICMWKIFIKIWRACIIPNYFL